jgi:hypothetical protein
MAAAVVLGLGGCAPERVDEGYEPSSRVPDYRAALREIDVPDEVIPPEPSEVTSGGTYSPVPFEREWVLGSPDVPYRLLLFETGESGRVSIDYSSEPAGVIYGVDLLRLGEERVVRVGSGNEESRRIAFRARRPARYALLVVPELLRSGVVTVSVAIER